jgi:hypothetical protein
MPVSFQLRTPLLIPRQRLPEPVSAERNRPPFVYRDRGNSFSLLALGACARCRYT